MLNKKGASSAPHLEIPESPIGSPFYISEAHIGFLLCINYCF